MKTEVQAEELEVIEEAGVEEASPSLTKSTPGWFMVNSRLFVGLVGAVAVHAWLFLTVVTRAFSQTATGTLADFFNLAFVAGVCVSLTVSWMLADFFSNRKLVQFILAFVLSAIGLVALVFVPDDALLQLIFSAFSGLGFGLIYVLYGEFLCLFFHDYVRIYINGIYLAAAVLCAGFLFAGPQMRFFFCMVFPVIAFVAYGVVLKLFKLNEVPSVPKAESDERHRVSWHSYLSTTTSGLSVGFAAGCIIFIADKQWWVDIVVLILVVVVCLLLFLDAAKLGKIDESFMMRMYLPISAVVVFPLLFADDSVKFVFVVLGLCWALVPTMCSMSAICRHVILFNLNAVRAISVGRFYSFAGMAVGMVIAYIGFSPTMGQLLGGVSSTFAVVAYMLLVIFSASFVMTEDNYPNANHVKAAAAADGETSNVLLPGTPIRKIDAGRVDGESVEEEDKEKKHPGIFRAKCDLIASQFGLSRRQREVLMMLAKGRNADYVAEQLVISLHTAKAHIYNIYQKTGVHSRQELMDLVEAVELPEDFEATQNSSTRS